MKDRNNPVRPAPKPSSDRTAPLRVEIISIGRELLQGSLADQNSPFVAECFSRRGAHVERITVVDDNEEAISTAVTDALERGARLVVTTGGLGPASDDRTLGAVADALRRPLTLHPQARRMVESAYRRLHEQGLVAKSGMNAARTKMCSIPLGCEPVPNPVGAAPGVLARLPGGGAVLCLPGAPDQSQAVLEDALGLLRDLISHGAVARREVETPSDDESALRPLLDRLAEEFPSVRIRSDAPGFGPKSAPIKVTLEARASNRAEAESAVEDAFRRLLDLAGR